MLHLVLPMLLGGIAPTQQDLSGQEIIVTASRRSSDGYDDRIPIIGLRRSADYAVQQVLIRGDTRDADKRADEIYCMIRKAIESAGPKSGVELATGEMVVEPLTLANYRHITLEKDNRPDSSKASFLVKVRIGGGVDGKMATERINAFIKQCRRSVARCWRLTTISRFRW